jgi:hypothetical protein
MALYLKEEKLVVLDTVTGELELVFTDRGAPSIEPHNLVTSSDLLEYFDEDQILLVR